MKVLTAKNTSFETKKSEESEKICKTSFAFFQDFKLVIEKKPIPIELINTNHVLDKNFNYID